MASENPSARDLSLACRKLGRDISPEEAHGLSVYLGLLETWNRRTNLVGPRTWPEMLESLVADSWHLADLLGGLALPGDPVTLDFGAGAGLPGIPLRLFWKAGRYVMIEPRAKRAAFLRQCLAMMRLTEAEVFEGRAEALEIRADVCLSRAFQPWRTFLATARGFAREGCRVVVFAGGKSLDGPAPEGWELTEAREYPRPGGRGYFWVFSGPSIASS